VVAREEVSAIKFLDTVKDRSFNVVAVGISQFNLIPETVHEGSVPGLADQNADSEVVPGAEGNDLT